MKKYIYILLVALLAWSCDDYTDIKPKGVTKTDDYGALKDLIETTIDGYAHGYTFYMLPDLESPAEFSFGSTTDPTYNKLYDIEDYYSEVEKSDRWFDWPSGEINQMNIILDNVEQSKGTPQEIEWLKSTALTRRAHIFYTIMNQFCPPFTEETADMPNTGWIPLYTESYDQNLTRSTLRESFTKCIDDLKIAADAEMGVPKYNTYGSTHAAQGLLAMFYMNMGDYTNALDYCNKSLTRYSFVRDYNTFEVGKEVVGRQTPKPTFHPEVILKRNAVAKIYGDYKQVAYSHAFVSEDLLSKFDMENDIRSKFIYEKVTGENSVYYWLGSRDYQRYEWSVTVPLLMLIQAECEARVGSFTKGIEILNNLRAKRFYSEYDSALEASNKEEAIEMILDEARRELAFTGHQFANVRRLNALHGANISINRKGTAGQQVTLEPNANRWTLAIPRYYIEKSPEIIQNPR